VFFLGSQIASFSYKWSLTNIKLFWYLIHVERLVRNSSITSTDVIVDVIEKD
jgi:hypothetical protein